MSCRALLFRPFPAGWRCALLLGLIIVLALARADTGSAAEERLRLIIETDAGGDPDDEQSLVRFLLYANEWDVEGIIANRPQTRDGENRNPERTGLGVVWRLLAAYEACYPSLVRHDSRYPTPAHLRRVTVPGYNHTNTAVALIIAAVDRDDPRPLWYSDWGTDHGAATNNLRRALDLVRAERGEDGYARFKRRLRLASADAFGEHTANRAPAFPLWVDTFRPPVDGRRWYHRFSDITGRAGGFEATRDLLHGHGPLGALYPTNTTHWLKEGDTMTFLYLVPTGMNDPNQPGWGSWAGRYGPNENFPGQPYFWANQRDAWNGTTHRDNVLIRWAADLQNDFRARLDWCVRPPSAANHAPVAVIEGDQSRRILRRSVPAGGTLALRADESRDPDGHPLRFEWFIYAEAGDYAGTARIEGAASSRAALHVPPGPMRGSIHVILAVRDQGDPPLAAYRRVVVNVVP
ncbi:MAG TPA: nucleoside hydrolase-like domain-containing protein [Methylomirabilota bacterium]|nr:nucleoside hydrolase-like domain-containing protein [Methylomirabilota bacterium]